MTLLLWYNLISNQVILLISKLEYNNYLFNFCDIIIWKYKNI